MPAKCKIGLQTYNSLFLDYILESLVSYIGSVQFRAKQYSGLWRYQYTIIEIASADKINMQNPTKTMVKLTRCSLVTTCSNLKERSATNHGQSEIFRKHTCIFFFDIIDALSQAIVNHPTILPYIYKHTDKKWMVCIGLWHCFTSITSIYGNIFKYKTIQPVDAPSWSRTRLRSAGTSAVPPDQGFSRDFMWFHGGWTIKHISNIWEYKTIWY